MKLIQTLSLFTFLLVIAAPSHATRIKDYIHQDIQLDVEGTFAVNISTEEMLRVGFDVKQEKKCEAVCVKQIKKLENGVSVSIGGQYGASELYKPINGQIALEYKNEAQYPVVIDIFKAKEICDSAACEYIKEKGLSFPPWDWDQVDFDWRRVLLSKVESMDTSEDKSISHIRGETVFGNKFDVTVLWWLIEDQNPSKCREWIPQYGNTTKASKAYQFSGSYMTKPIQGIFTDVGCSLMEFKEQTEKDL